jgi:hypothetical protein
VTVFLTAFPFPFFWSFFPALRRGVGDSHVSCKF